MDPSKKVRYTLDYIFGPGVSRALPLEELEYTLSPNTGRLRSISVKGRHVASFRPDGAVTLSPFGASLLLRSKAFRHNCVVVADAAADAVSGGGSVFAKHLVSVGSRIRPTSEVAVLDRTGRVLATGKAILGSEMLKRFKVGVAVKVRRGSGETGRS